MSENQTNVDVVADQLGVKAGKLKGMPTTVEDNVIGSSRTNKKGGKKAGAVGNTNNGAIGSKAADNFKKESSAPKKEAETVAVFSTKNVSWDGVGSISKGYNIMSKDQAEKWLTRNHTHLATPEEVAEEYGL